ncbi:MAG: hypothetical protein ABDH37_04510 [Candidatus Hydrothermales bacterium]
MILILIILNPIFDEEKFFSVTSKKLNLPLNEISLDKEGFEIYGYGKFRLKIFDNLIFSPIKAPTYIKTISEGVLQNSDSLWALTYYGFARMDEGVRRGLIEKPHKRLIDSLKEINPKKYLNNLFDFLEIKEKIEIKDENLLKGLIFILKGVKLYLDEIKEFTKNIKEEDFEKVLKGLEEKNEDGLSNPQIEKMVESVDFKIISRLSNDLSFFVQKGTQFLKNSSFDNHFELNSSYGKIIVGRKENNIYDSPFYLLIIEPEGNDEYLNSSLTYKNFPLSILIDISGDDKYKGRNGVGLSGTSILIDLKGNDEYVGEKITIGAGLFGYGIVLDFEGNDKYFCDSYGEGAGLFGVGILSDLKGDDFYEGFQGIQGFGFVKGCGLLIDREGNDFYIARNDTVKYPSPQSERHNVSLAQGTGFGTRADFTDGHSLAGGIGFLIEGSGNDKYLCSVFGQGCGYWMGSGFLVDFDGNDEYKGVWYTQGACAHFAIGMLMDLNGDDKYKTEMNMGIGAGHDFSLGYFIDYKGNELYEAPNLSLGSGNANGMGIFIDYEGNDEYKTKGGITLGKANIDLGIIPSLRKYIKCIGIFIDVKGKDKYYEKFARNKKIWKQKIRIPAEINIGIDF